MPEKSVPSAIFDSLGPIRVAFLGSDPAGATAQRETVPKETVPKETVQKETVREEAQRRFDALRRAPPNVEVLVNRQVHSARVSDASAAPEDADGLFEDAPTRALCVVTADCVPVLLCDPQGAAVCAIHAGWRGLAEGIIAVGARRFQSPSHLAAWIGPSIGPCCYEVSKEVAAKVAVRSGSGVLVEALGNATDAGASRKPFIDLAGAAMAQLNQAGVENVQVHRVCTRCNAQWHSYRREGPGQGRNHAFVWVEEG